MVMQVQLQASMCVEMIVFKQVLFPLIEVEILRLPQPRSFVLLKVSIFPLKYLSDATLYGQSCL